VDAPQVSSAVYPENPPAPTGEPGLPGTFVFTPNDADDVRQYVYGSDPYGLYDRVDADGSGAAVIEWAPWEVGEQTLYVASIDHAFNRSPVRAYTFNVGPFPQTASS
jgi:hypothetical protein